MAIPDFQSLMLPLLKYLGDGVERQKREFINALAKQFDLSDEERNELLPSGKQTVFFNRVSWARSYLKHAGTIEYPSRGMTRITERGSEVLRKKPEKIDIKFLEQFEEFQEFRPRKKNRSGSGIGNDINDEVKTPEEILESAFENIQSALVDELLTRVKQNPPEFFEKLVVELLVKMGYGGSHKDAGKAVGQSNDGGIDGIIKEDRLGLDTIYIQAKRWENTVTRPEIQKFAGALLEKRAKKGVFITTSTFSNGARESVERFDSRIVLIDGEQLAQFMIESNVGVSPVQAYEVKRIDTDYFDDI